MRELAGRRAGAARAPGRAGPARLSDRRRGAAWQAFGERQGGAPALQVDAALAPGGYRIEEAGG